MISRDPDKTPDIDPEAVAEALKQGLHPIAVICDEPGAKVGDPVGVQFIAFVAFMPRIGEEIRLQDGKTCQVTRIVYKVTRLFGNSIFMMPNVRAILRGA